MPGQLRAKSSSRNGAAVLWIAVHTAEGAYDDDPADPAEDPGSADQLLDYFSRPTVQASSHAIADDDVLLDDLVPYDRASWTLRGGNPRSDNLELCGRAGWSRDTWLEHGGLLRNCATWIARRARARGWSGRLVRIGAAGVRSRLQGVIGHVDYTEGADDGSHWDPGPGFPWDVVLAQANAILAGRPPATNEQEDEMSAADVQAINDHTDAALGELKRTLEGNLGAAAVNNPRAWLNAGIAARVSLNTRAQLAPLLDDEAKLAEQIGELPAGVDLADVQAALRVVLAEGLPAGPA